MSRDDIWVTTITLVTPLSFFSFYLINSISNSIRRKYVIQRMDSPSRRSALSDRRSSRRTTKSPYARSAVARSVPTVPAAIPRTSSIRSLFNLISSPFRSAAPVVSASGIQDDQSFSEDESGSENGSFKGSDRSMNEEDEEGENLGSGQNDHQYQQQIPSSQTISNFRLPPPPPSSKEWPLNSSDSRFLSGHAPPQKSSSAFQAQLTHSPSSSSSFASSQTDFQSFMSRSQTMPSLNGSPSSAVGLLGPGTTSRSQIILKRAVGDVEEGRNELSLEEVEECRRILSQSRSTTVDYQQSAVKHQPFSAASPLFHPGSSILPPQNKTPIPSTPFGLTRSTSNLSFLSPSRFRASNNTSSLPSSPGVSFSSSARASTGTPRRRPIYLGPGSGSSSRRRPAVGRSFFDLESSQNTKPSVETPGKKRRLEDKTESVDEEAERKKEDWIIERALSGLGAAASPRSSSTAAPSGDSSTPSSPFTFFVPVGPSVPSVGVPSLSFSPSQSLPSNPIPPSSLSVNQSLRGRTSLALSAKYKNPSLVAPSPLRQSTRFADSPEGKKAAVDSGASPKVLSKTSKMMMDLIKEENAKYENPAPPQPTVETASTPSTPSVAHRRTTTIQPTFSPVSTSTAKTDAVPSSSVVSAATSTIYNPYQSSGIVAPSPRRNPRRSIAATSRSRASTGSPARQSARDTHTQVQKPGESDAESTPTSKRQRNKSFGGKNIESKRMADEVEMEDENRDEDVIVLDDFRTLSKPPTSTTSSFVPAPSETNGPPKVLFELDMSVSDATTKMSDPQIDINASPTKETLNVLKNLESPALRSSKSSPLSLFNSVSSTTKQALKPESFTPFGQMVSFGRSSASSTDAVPNPASKVSPPSTTNDGPSKDPRTVALQAPSFVLPIFNFRFAARLSPLPKTAEESKALMDATKVEADRLPKIDLLDDGAKKAKPASSATAITGGGFNWAAAGLKPTTTSADKWTCPTCSISNAQSASKCIACEEPQPKSSGSKPINDTSSLNSVSSTNTGAVTTGGGGGFNWAAAGMKPVAPSTDKWPCPTCGISNGLTDSKCLACEEPRPASASGSAPASAAPKQTTGGFNWAAAGMKVPEKKKGWECGVCMVQNGEADSACVSCETKRG